MQKLYIFSKILRIKRGGKKSYTIFLFFIRFHLGYRITEDSRFYPKKPRHVSEKVLKNRVAATSVGPGFVAFLAITCIVLIFCCISYLQAKSVLTYKIKDVARVESELSQLKEENIAYEAQLTTNIDLNTVKAIAIGRLGMRTPTPDQRKTYKLADNRSYVRQYISIDAVK